MGIALLPVAAEVSFSPEGPAEVAGDPRRELVHRGSRTGKWRGNCPLKGDSPIGGLDRRSSLVIFFICWPSGQRTRMS